MRYTICIELPNEYYTVNHLLKSDVEAFASATAQNSSSCFYLGSKYDLKDLKSFKVFGYEKDEDFSDTLNAHKELHGEGVFRTGGFVDFLPYTLSKMFQEYTGEFVKRFSFNANNDESKLSYYISPLRIEDFMNKKNPDFDFKRLIKLCDEINESFLNKSYIATIILVRALLDHIPPIFQKKSFSEVANNYGSKSFKDTMLFLENTSRKIADHYLHHQISRKEDLPTEQQVQFSQALDLLLGEIIKLA